MTYTPFLLNGAWEMVYQEDKYIKTQSPAKEIFENNKECSVIEDAVPDYWEDMGNKFA